VRPLRQSDLSNRNEVSDTLCVSPLPAHAPHCGQAEQARPEQEQAGRLGNDRRLNLNPKWCIH